MRLLPHSIRWRIQLWHGLLLLAVLVALGVTAYRLQLSNELRNLDSELRLKLFVIHGEMARGPDAGRPPQEDGRFGPLDTRSNTFDLPPPPRDERKSLMDRADVATTFAGDTYFIVWHRDGALMDRSLQAPDNDTRPTRTGEIAARSRNGFREAYEFTPPGECLLVGTSETGLKSAMNLFMLKLFGFGTALFAAGSLIGLWIASRAIAPIRDISAAASRIANGHLDERIALSPTNSGSELGQLVVLLNDTFSRLAKLIEDQQRFTSDAAHELRTPLAIILAQTQLALTRKRESAADQKTIEMTRRAAERMHSLTESLLILASADSDRAAPSEPLALDELSLENIELIRPLLDEKGIRLHEDLWPASCLGRSEHMNQILVNLLSNAAKYCRAGDEVRVSTHRENGHAILTVADTGPGIAAEHLPNLFERFYRADASRNRSTGGAGLGLAICKVLAEAQGGNISVQSALEKGTTFEVRLPAEGKAP